MNKHNISDYIYIFSTVLFTVASQLVMRWQVNLAGPLPLETVSKLHYIWGLLINPWILIGVIFTFLAGVSWMLTMTKFEISYAYPFVSLNFIIVLIAGYLVFDETFTQNKVIGSLVIVIGIIILAKG